MKINRAQRQVTRRAQRHRPRPRARRSLHRSVRARDRRRRAALRRPRPRSRQHRPRRGTGERGGATRARDRAEARVRRDRAHSTCDRAAGGHTSMRATLHTNHGPIEVELYPNEAPKTVENFVKLTRDGFYDGLIFHRVIPDFMIQGGDPTGTGCGGPGYQFEDEFNQHRVDRGALAMANAGPNTNGSQFFIVTADACPWLDGKHTVFGRVTNGMDIADKISTLPSDASDKPHEDALIERVELADPE